VSLFPFFVERLPLGRIIAVGWWGLEVDTILVCSTGLELGPAAVDFESKSSQSNFPVPCPKDGTQVDVNRMAKDAKRKKLFVNAIGCTKFGYEKQAAGCGVRYRLESV